MDALDLFDRPVRDWFKERFGSATDVQAQAWPRIASREHLLVTAPTGSGKTLTAFLWALQELARRSWDSGGVRLLYVSPLKALNNDIGRNLVEPLRAMEELYGDAWPGVRVAVRSGDTPESERRRMLRSPPEILVTTPESLNLLLASPRARRILTGIRTVILDEIHAVAGNKRGSYLMSAVERLVPLSGEFQRIALSATVRPLDTVAAFAGGYGANGRPRPVGIIESTIDKRLDVSVLATEVGPEGTVWPPIVARCRELLATNRATLFFVNNRALCERLVRWINDEYDAPIAYAHHGSLARELRELVETKLKAGELKALVATSSLELGIDIGDLDEVVLIQSPRTLNSAVQRVGRAGHKVGEVSRARIFPTHGRDLLDAAVLAPLVESRAVEAVRPVRNPLDVLAQVIVAMCVTDDQRPDDLFELLKNCWTFRTLRREAFDRVVAMLRGRYSDSRIRELRPRLREDLASGLLRSNEGARMLVFRSGGVIPDRGYYTLRVQGSGARLGELDEEFVWERRRGEGIHIGAQTWRIERITRNEVEVVPGKEGDAMAPFWKAEPQGREFELADRIGRLVEELVPRLGESGLADELCTRHMLDEPAADSLIGFLKRQKDATGGHVPHRHLVLIEQCKEPGRGGQSMQVILHASWGARVLRPLSLALAAAWEERYAAPLEAFSNDECILMQVPLECTEIRTIFDLVRSDNVEALVKRRLENSGFFGARFRENCQRALLLPRGMRNQRIPLWLNRLRAQRLLNATARYPDFPMRAETWRTCLEDEFDLERLTRLLEEVGAGEIAVRHVTTREPSPFAENVAWRATNLYMYEDDKGLESRASALSEQVLQEVLHDAALRPRLEDALIEAFEAKLQRTAAGYAPEEESDWIDLVEECVLCRRVSIEGGLPLGLERVEWGGGWIVSTLQHARLDRARAGDEPALVSCLAEFLRTRGPRTLAALCEAWEVSADRMRDALATLVEEGTVVADRLREDAIAVEFCDRENLERLLRLRRARRRARFEALPIERLPLFLATHQGIVHRGQGPDDLPARLEALFGYPASAALWEEAILPARLEGYRGEWLDALLRDSDLTWLGAGRERICFAFREDARLLLAAHEEAPEGWPDPRGSYEFFDLEALGGGGSAEWTRRLWSWAWEGRVVNDTFAVLRKGIENRFEPEQPRGSRRAFRSWQSSRPLVGNWRALLLPSSADRLEEAEDDRQRARLLLARYGVLFRELCANELPPLRWGRLLRALRRMELSGEVLAGQFFEGIEGLQFCTHEAFRLLSAPPELDAPFWINAQDPASLCGLGIAHGLPSRVASNWLVYRGTTLLIVARRGGEEVEIRAPVRAEDLSLFRELLARDFRAPARIEVRRVDGAEATALFLEAGFYEDRETLVLERTY